MQWRHNSETATKWFSIIICAHEREGYMVTCYNSLFRTALGQYGVISFLSFALTHLTGQFQQIFNNSCPIIQQQWQSSANISYSSLTKTEPQYITMRNKMMKSPIIVFNLPHLLFCSSTIETYWAENGCKIKEGKRQMMVSISTKQKPDN